MINHVVVFGSTGMLGYAVEEYFQRLDYKVTGITRLDFDIAHDPIEVLESVIEEDDVVINCAGVIKPRIAAHSIEEVLTVNAMFPRNLARLSKTKGVRCLHITTDCVYSGRRGEYDENDYFDADDLYGLSKIAGENAECMVLRTSIIGEERGQNRSLLEWARSQAGKTISGFTNHFWNGVTTVYLAEIIEKILVNNLYREGIFHIHSPNTVAKHELVSIFNKVYNLDLTITPTEAQHACDRSLSSLFPFSRDLVTKTIEQQVQEMKEFFGVLEPPGAFLEQAQV
jgi:dTDP-4-dehydrorhamnose reductase